MEIPETGGRIPYKKNQKAIALKVLIETISERKIGFQSPNFNKKYAQFFQNSQEVLQNYKQNNENLNKLYTTNEYNEFLNLFKNSFPWKLGKYNGVIKAKIANRSKEFYKSFEFVLTNLDVRRLEKNIDLCEKFWENHFIKQDPDFFISFDWIETIDLDNN